MAIRENDLPGIDGKVLRIICTEPFFAMKGKKNTGTPIFEEANGKYLHNHKPTDGKKL